MLFFLFKPKEGIDSNLLNSSNIDSITVVKSQQGFTIKSRSEINNITTTLANTSEIKHPDRMNINSDFYDLRIYGKEKQSPETIRVLFNEYNGTVISAGEIYYQGESLDEVINSLRPK